MNARSAQAAGPNPHHSLAYNLAGITVLVLLAAIGAIYLVDEIARQTRTPLPTLEDGNRVTQTLAGNELTIPTAWFRYDGPQREGFTNQIDLRVMYVPTSATATPINVTLLPRSRVRTSSALLDGVYLRQFDEQTLASIPGLVGKPMSGGNGYSGETIWYDALSPNPFVAKCLDAVEPDGTAQCVRTVHLATGIAAVYSFDATVLQSWRQFDTEMERWLGAISAW